MTRPRRRPISLLVSTLVVISLLATGVASARTYWYERYLRAVDLIDSGRPGDATILLEQLIKQRPEPAVAVRLPGNQYIDYLPYYQTARAQAGLGKFLDADHALARSVEYGAIERCRRRHARELDRLQSTIKAQTW